MQNRKNVVRAVTVFHHALFRRTVAMQLAEIRHRSRVPETFFAIAAIEVTGRPAETSRKAGGSGERG